MDKVCGIYQIKNEINGKIYIGKSVDIFSRWQRHKDNAKDIKEKSYLYLAMRKYGIENFSFSIIEELPKDKLNERECFWIKTKQSHYSFRKGYNCTWGGEDGELTGFAKESMKRTLKKKYSSGELSVWNKGKQGCFSEQTLKQMSEKRLGSSLSEETKFKIVLSNMITAHGQERTFQAIKLTEIKTGKETYHENVYWLSKWLTGSASYFKESLWDWLEGNVSVLEKFSKLGILTKLYKIEKVSSEEFDLHKNDLLSEPPDLSKTSWEKQFTGIDYVKGLECLKCCRKFPSKTYLHNHLSRTHKWTENEFLALKKEEGTIKTLKCKYCGKELSTSQILLNREFCSTACVSRAHK